MNKIYTFFMTVAAVFLTAFAISVPTLKQAQESPWLSGTETWFAGLIYGTVLTIIWFVTILAWLEKE